MDFLPQYIISEFGFLGVAMLIIFFILKQLFNIKLEKVKDEQNELTQLRKALRDREIQALKDYIENVEQGLSKHISRHVEYEKNICMKIDKIYERLNPMGDSVGRILGFMEAQNAKGK
jgi:uncharacterized membrane-anchored protein YhcB (DUF1043 family)